MRRAVRYTARFEFLREAAFHLVRRDGPAAVTGRAVAAQLGISDATVRRLVDPSAVLVTLAAHEAAGRRRRATNRMAVVDQLLPDAERVDAEVVWWRLVLALAPGEPRSNDEAATLRSRYQVADRGYADEPTPASPAANPEGVDPEATERARRRDAFAPYVEDRDEEMSSLLRELPGPAAVARALVDGLSVGVCTGRLAPSEAHVVLRTYLALVPEAGRQHARG